MNKVTMSVKVSLQAIAEKMVTIFKEGSPSVYAYWKAIPHDTKYPFMVYAEQPGEMKPATFTFHFIGKVNETMSELMELKDSISDHLVKETSI